MSDSTDVPNSERQKKNHAGYLTAIGVVVLSLVTLSIFSLKSTSVETKQAPVIEALERYKSENGKYPDNLELLTPEILKVLPGCMDSIGSTARYNFDPKDGHYTLICHNFAFSNSVYSSRDNTWMVLD